MFIDSRHFFLPDQSNKQDATICVQCTCHEFGDLPDAILVGDLVYQFAGREGWTAGNLNSFNYNLVESPTKDQLSECLQWENHKVRCETVHNIDLIYKKKSQIEEAELLVKRLEDDNEKHRSNHRMNLKKIGKKQIALQQK